MHQHVPFLACCTDTHIIESLTGKKHKFGVQFGFEEVEDGGEGKRRVVFFIGFVFEPHVEFGDYQEWLDFELIVVSDHLGGVDEGWVSVAVLSTR